MIWITQIVVQTKKKILWTTIEQYTSLFFFLENEARRDAFNKVNENLFVKYNFCTVHTQSDGVVAELGEQRLHLCLPALPERGERVALEGVEVRLTGARHDEAADAVRVPWYVVVWTEKNVNKEVIIRNMASWGCVQNGILNCSWLLSKRQYRSMNSM